MKHGSLFSGIGGFDLASEWMGWDNVFSCEINPFGRKVLNHYWPNTIHYEDINKTDFTIHRGGIDILTGGFPCQPFSQAGKRRGTEDDRHLWPRMLEVIREVQPSYVVGENVYGLINWDGGLVFDQIQADLEAEGYEVQPVILPACAVNAPHRRDRIWFIAYSRNITRRAAEGCEDKQGWGLLQDKQRGSEIRGESSGCDCVRTTSHTNSNTKRSSGASREAKGDRSQNDDEQGRRREQAEQYIRRGNVSRDAANTNDKGLQRGEVEGGIKGSREKRNKQLTGCVRSVWKDFPTQSPICSGNDEFSDRLDGITFSKWRNESIKAYGNAIVPNVVYEIFKTIEQLFLEDQSLMKKIK